MDDLELFMLFFMIVTTYVLLNDEEEVAEDTLPRKRMRKVNLIDETYGCFETCINNLKMKNPKDFFKHTRMAPDLYETLQTLLTDNLTKCSQRQPISPECRLAITLSYLSQGTSHQVLSWNYQIGRTTIRKVILETCEVIWNCLAKDYVSVPNEEDFKQIAEDFLKIWDLPNCVGAIDGKHISLKSPRKADSESYNHKNIVILATCDTRFKFTTVDIGPYSNQGGILATSKLGKSLSSGKLQLPNDTSLPNTNIEFPYYFVGNSAFPLKRNVLRIYPGKSLDDAKKVYNYRISRAQASIDNAFGILVSRWKILKNTLTCFSENAEKVVLATIALHNFILKNNQSSQMYCPPGYVDQEDEHGNITPGTWRKYCKDNSLFAPTRMGSNNAPVSIFQQRDILKTYFMKAGKIDLQELFLTNEAIDHKYANN